MPVSPLLPPTVSAPPHPNVQLIYGPMLVGVFMNMIFYGVLAGQTLTYFQIYNKKDALWLRLFIAFLFCVETANTALDMSMMYQPLILEYGQKPVLFPQMFMTQPLCVAFISAPIQIFFAWRIYKLTNRPWIPLVICVFAVASFAGGLWTSAMIQILQQFSKKPLLHDSALLWCLASCVADVLITISLVVTLMRRKTGFSATDTIVDKIIRTTIQTGMITSIFNILDVVCFMALPHYAVNFVWDLALSKLYSNCLLSTLNARQTLGSITEVATTTATAQTTRTGMIYQRRGPLVFADGRTGSGPGKEDTMFDSAPGTLLYNGGCSASGDSDRDCYGGIRMSKAVEHTTEGSTCEV